MAEKKKVQAINPEVGALRVMAEQLIGRAATAYMAGQSYGGQRKLYDALGYNAAPTFQDYYNVYNRQDIGRRVVKAPVTSSWLHKPAIEENLQKQPGERTEFEKAWDLLVKDLRLFHYLVRADRIAGIGEFGGMFLGYDDGQELSEEVNKANLMFLHPYHQGSLTIDQWEEDAKNERFGQPRMYKVKMALPGAGQGTTGQDKLVHWSRMLHIAEDTTENDVLGTPRLQCVYNRLQDLEKVAGGSAEMFWRGAFPGYGLKADPEFEFGADEMEAMEEEIKKFVHDLQRYIRLVGVDVKELGGQVADPSNHVDVLIQLISSATSIPKRILTGSERGELASIMDERNWNTYIDGRRVDHNELLLIRPLVSRLVDSGTLPAPGKDGYSVHWEDLSAPTEKERAEVAKLVAEALAVYAKTPGMDMIMPWSVFLRRVMLYSEEEIEQMEKAIMEDDLDAEVTEAEENAARALIEQELRDAGWQPPQLPAPVPGLPAPEE